MIWLSDWHFQNFFLKNNENQKFKSGNLNLISNCLTWSGVFEKVIFIFTSKQCCRVVIAWVTNQRFLRLKSIWSVFDIFFKRAFKLNLKVTNSSSKCSRIKWSTLFSRFKFWINKKLRFKVEIFENRSDRVKPVNSSSQETRWFGQLNM